MTFLKTLQSKIRRKGHKPAPFYVDTPLYAIGDIHGRCDLLERVFRLIEQDAHNRSEMSKAQIVYLGDYIDRGDQSAQVLASLYDIVQSGAPHHVFLKGNHEEMLVKFLNDPARYGARWMRYGGIQTMASFGIRGIREHMSPVDLQHVGQDLQAAMGNGMIEWLQNLPLTYRSGNVVCVHAALDPNHPWDVQKAKTCLWGQAADFNRPRRDGYWVLHGHTIVDQVYIANGRISIDTGAYATGCLTVLGLYQDQSWILQT